MKQVGLRTSWLLVGLVLGCAVQAANGSRAAACSRSSCFDPVRTFGPDARVPGNLVRFAISTVSDASELSLSLQTEGGVELPLEERSVDGARVFEPAEPIAPDTAVALHYSYTCGGPSTSEVYRFTTGEAVELRVMPSSLTLIKEGTSSSGSVDTAFKRFRYQLPAPQQAKHLLVHAVTLDGELLREPGSWSPADDGTITVTVSCDGTLTSDTCGGVSVVEPGLHELRVATTVIGEQAQPEPIAIGVHVSCDGVLCSVSQVRPARSGNALACMLVLTACLMLRLRRRAI